MTFPTAVLDTPHGKIVVTATDANHVAVSGGDVARNIPIGEHFIVNGVRYNLHAHLSRYEDAARPFQPQRTYFGMGAGQTVSDRFHEEHAISLRRTDNYKDGSEAAIRKVRSVLVDTVNKFLATETGKALLAEAECQDDNHRLDAAESAVQKAREELATAKIKLNEVRASIGLDPEDFA